jgi:hypothetical protein
VEGIWLLAILACPLLMGAMMLFMMRGMRGRDTQQPPREEDQGPRE